MQDVELPVVQVPEKTNRTQIIKINSFRGSLDLAKNLDQLNRQMLQEEINRLKKVGQSLGQVVRKVDVSRSQQVGSIDSLNKQSRQLEDKIQSYQRSLQQSFQKQTQKSIQSNKKLYISKWQQRIQTASSINVDTFSDLDIDDKKSIANELFKWIIVTIYHQPQNKYYFPNFKEQLFEKDDGKDFKQRLGKVNAANAKQQQIYKIKHFLSKYNEILQAQQFTEIKSLPQEAEKLRKIAQIYLQCYQLAKNTLQLQKSIQNEKQNSLKKDQQAMKWKARHQAVQQRLQVIQQYLYTLSAIETELKNKIKQCEVKTEMAQQFLSNIKKGIQINQEQLEKYASM